jgi:3-methyladenine DNA glycosylase AlkD
MRELFAALRKAADPARKKFLASYFGSEASSEYRGLTAVAARRVAVAFADRFTLAQLRRLLSSRSQEHRYVALEMLVHRYETRSSERAAIVKLYCANLRRIDHWVLVDTSAPYILGAWLLARPRTILFRLAASAKPAERRIAMVATWTFIKAGDFADARRIADRLARDPDRLVRRAVGWMLREIARRETAGRAAGLRTRRAGGR